jgi:hypothetical protein
MERGLHRHGDGHHGSAGTQLGTLLGAQALQHQHRHGCDCQCRQKLLGGQGAAQRPEHASANRAHQGPEQQPGGDGSRGGADRDQQQQVVDAAEGMQEACGQSAAGEAMGLGGLIKQQGQSGGTAEQGQGPGRKGLAHREIRSAPEVEGLSTASVLTERTGAPITAASIV